MAREVAVFKCKAKANSVADHAMNEIVTNLKTVCSLGIFLYLIL